MATKKQRRRREKLQRHEYEYVIETEEGEEIPVESPRAVKPGTAKAPEKVVDRRGREIKPPSWERVLKRTAIFGPILAVFVFLTGGDTSVASQIFTIVLLLAVFIPFSYLTDRFIYRSVQRRQQRSQGRS